jgi:hypothetical protein
VTQRARTRGSRAMQSRGEACFEALVAGQLGGDGSYATVAMTAGAMITRLTVLSSFPPVRVYLSEQFPTTLRGRGHLRRCRRCKGLALHHERLPYFLGAIRAMIHLRALILISGGRARLVQPPASGMAAVDHDEASFCVEALEDALAHHGKPEIVNTEQGSQFTGSALTGVLLAINMDDKGAWRDNVFVERLWRTIIAWSASSKPPVTDLMSWCACWRG